MYQRQRNFEQSEQEAHSGKQQVCFTTKMNEPQCVNSLSPMAQPTMDTSFQQNLAEEHAQAIWNSSIQFLKNSLRTNFDESKGFNDGNIFEFCMEHKNSINEQMEPFELMGKNEMLSYDKKKELMVLLKNSVHLKDLMQKLYHMFSEEIYEEILIIVYQSLSNYRLYKESTKLNKEFAQLMGPSYSDLDLDTIKVKPTTDHYLFKTEPEIIDKADEAGNEIAGSYFINTKIRFLNLKQVDAPQNNSNVLRSEFAKFIQTITESVYLCVEGCFTNPNEVNLLEGQSEDMSMTDKTSGELEIAAYGRKRRNQ